MNFEGVTQVTFSLYIFFNKLRALSAVKNVTSCSYAETRSALPIVSRTQLQCKVINFTYTDYKTLRCLRFMLTVH